MEEDSPRLRGASGTAPALLIWRISDAKHDGGHCTSIGLGAMGRLTHGLTRYGQRLQRLFVHGFFWSNDFVIERIALYRNSPGFGDHSNHVLIG